MALRILLTGGGSSGHAYPLVAVAEELKRSANEAGVELKLRFIGASPLLGNLALEIGAGFDRVISPKWRRYASWRNIFDIFKIPVGVFQSLFFVWRFMPDLVFSKGGYDSFLPAVSGKILAIPLAIHDSDAFPGRANLLLKRIANLIFISFKSAEDYFPKEKIKLVGNPIRRGLLNRVDKIAAISAFGLDPAKPVILITGASQGAGAINDVIVLSLADLIKKFQIIHQCGPKNFQEISGRILDIIKESHNEFGGRISQNYRLYPLLNLEQMAAAYSACDLVVSRAGAGAIFESAVLGKPTIVVPLKNSAGGHQLANAMEFAKFGATFIEESNLSPHILLNEIDKVFKHKDELSKRIREFAVPNAAAAIASEILNMLKTGS